jgi:sugar phosphate isomerase/epimerase
MARIPMAVQLYSVRKDCAEDLPGTLSALAEMGYEGVEFAGYYDRTAAELRQLLDARGLKAAGSHVRGHELAPENLAATAEFHQTLGNKYLIIPWMDPSDDRQVWLDLATRLNQAAEKLAPHGLRTGFHNHGHEFKPIQGETPWDIVAGNTRPEVVMQLDLGNACHGGADPMAYLRKYLDRMGTVHLKEFSATNDKPLIGEGDIPWETALGAIEAGGKTEWFIVEQEVYPVPPREAVRRCREFLRTLGR